MLSTTQCQPWERKRRSLPGQLRLSITLSLDIQDRDWGSALENLLENKTGIGPENAMYNLQQKTASISHDIL